MMMKILEEGSLSFNFKDEYNVIKFDDSRFYRNHYNHLPEAKGVDFIAYNDNEVIFIEVKDCLGNETENKWRTSCEDKYKGEDTFCSEVSKKVASTFSCILGASTYSKDASDSADEISVLLNYVKADNYKEKSIKVYLILEGEFKSDARSGNTIRERIGSRISGNLKWIHCCSTGVYNISEVRQRKSLAFSVERISKN